MFINSNTRISDLIKYNKNSIDAIASIAKPLEKLKNPILRKIMASRVTIAEAAKMGGCKVSDIMRALQPLGFEFENKSILSPEESQERTKPEWLTKLDFSNIEDFDVRAILTSGDDPLKQIIKRFKDIKPGNSLCIINSFIPTPLVRLLEKDGVKTYTEIIHPNEYHTFFFKSLSVSIKNKGEAIKEEASTDRVFMDNSERFTEIKKRFANEKIKEIDVRHLEMPMPMQTILGELSALKTDEVLYVNHKRIPIYLLEELAEQDFQIHVLTLGENDVKLLIFHF